MLKASFLLLWSRMKNLKQKSDGEIVKLCLRDNELFGVLIERYEAKLTRYIKRLTRIDSQTAEDILQESFIKAYVNLNDFDDTFPFSSWIYRITHNEVINYLRKLKSGPQTISMDGDKEAADLIAILSDDTDLHAELQTKDFSAKIRLALYEIPENYREVLVLRFMEDKSYREIGDILRKSIGNVSILINRAKKELKNKISILNL